MTDQEPRFTEPLTAVDHMRRVARETAVQEGYEAAGWAVLAVRREYRIRPWDLADAPPNRLAAREAVRLESMALVPLAAGGRTNHALFDERVATPANQPLSGQPDWAPDPALALQAAALRAQSATTPGRPAPSLAPPVDRSPSR